ncbi:Ribonuclease III [Rickettsia prowazekii str. Rp22]|uniref:Ribonuclease 3 n=1 Tax=Rickettsia prowazekii (strain Rp22) TaxID=449216 RepID=D5AW36_RICPP|nr:ribonuclease III [Rickettsia prowazekii]ADE29625.1 Ribonuclease III [Rickettsia prowazekii str. Rp22]
MESFEKLETLLGYSFKNKELLIEALSHPSLRQYHEYKYDKDYERLEFLGDAVLNLLITEILFKNFENYKEGNLAKIRSYLVCKETICIVGTKLALKDYIIMTHGEEVAGGRDNPNNIENATEALIAAIYLDSNIEITHNIIEKLWAEFMKVQNFTDYDPKTALQEWAQANSHHLPIYRLIKREGAAHSSIFTVLVKVKDYEQTCTGYSIKEAEKKAARSLLHRLK